ncbi:hypothetical protein J4Q44_G00145120 [Coregonus suidteri]|uniref:Apoptosis facilitator Bcl-2-like protein 14 n=1 Tax=Coregonus suidteri TaxID=861788 RepID=A0AAN8LM62_9TELE
MANRNANGSTNSNVNGSAKAGLPGDMDGTEDSVEFRLMMAYAQRRRPREVLCPLPQGTVTQPGPPRTPPPASPTGTQRSCFRSFGNGSVGDELNEVVDRLTQIADGVSFSPWDLETDGEEDAIETELFGSYSFYEWTISTFLRRLGLTSDPSTQGSPKAQIALTCEVTSRLSAVNNLPMSRVLGFGAKYLQDYFSSWARQQGGYEEAFVNDDEEEVD